MFFVLLSVWYYVLEFVYSLNQLGTDLNKDTEKGYVGDSRNRD